MEKLSNLLTTKKWAFWKPEWDKLKFVNHGMGFLGEGEHAELLRIGAITCKFGVDSIKANYPVVKISKENGESTNIDLGGNIFQCQKEANMLQKQGKKAKVVFWPKAYFEYLERKNPKRDFAEEDNEALNSLVEDLQF